MGRGSVVSNLSVRLCVRVWGAGTVALSDRPAVDFRFDYMTKYLVSKTASIRECGHITVHYSFYDTIRYDTRCYFNVRSKANASQLNLPHGIVSFIFLHKKKKPQIHCSMPNPPRSWKECSKNPWKFRPRSFCGFYAEKEIWWTGQRDICYWIAHRRLISVVYLVSVDR